MKPKTKAYVDRRLETTAHQLVMMLDSLDTRLTTLEQAEPPAPDITPWYDGVDFTGIHKPTREENDTSFTSKLDIVRKLIEEAKPLPTSLPFVNEDNKVQWTGVADLTAERIYDGLVNERLFALFDAVWSKERAIMDARIAKLEGEIATLRYNMEMGE